MIKKWITPDARTQSALLCVLCVSAVSLMGGCRGDREDKPPRQFFPDMDDGPKYKPQSESPFYADGRSMRPVVEGTVPYGRADFDIDSADPSWAGHYKAERADLIKEDDAFYRGISGTAPDGKPQYITTIPVPVTAELLKRGQERYNIYCVVCHGYNGTANGTVAPLWTGRAVANLLDPKYSNPREPDQKGSDGFLFHTARHGVPNPADTTGLNPKMPGYAHALTERDTWAIVAYIRALQESVPLDQVPEPRRSQLKAEQDKLPAPKGNP